MRADEAVLAHRLLQLAQPLHPARLIDPREPREAIGVRRAHVGNHPVRDFPRSLHVQIAGTHRDQQRSLDPGAVHLAQIIVDRQAVPHVGRHPHLALEIVVDKAKSIYQI